MTTDIDIDSEDRAKWSPWAIAAAVLLLLLFAVIAVGTVRGCFDDPKTAAERDEAKKKKEEEDKKKKKDPFEIMTPLVLPSEPKLQMPLVKPGHWAMASQEMISHEREFIGDSQLTVGNSRNEPFTVDKTPFYVRATRPVLLTKARPKTTETTFFVPNIDQGIRLMMELDERGRGPMGQQLWTQLTPMPSYQYQFVIVAKEPTRYGYIKSLDSVSVPYDGQTEMDDTADPLHYTVIQLKADKSVALPDNPLTWSTIAYVLWDAVDPGDPITVDQERALVDWLHWGGQLIISGPDSLDLLKGSFLEPYLPAVADGPRTLAADDPALAELNRHWLISTAKVPGEPIKVNAPWSGIKLKLLPSPQVKALPNTGELFVERQVGRGRVIVSAVRLAERDFINWRSGFESFFNACLLRRPPREYREGAFGDLTLEWASRDLKPRRLDASLTTKLRYFTRDLGVETAYRRVEVDDGVVQGPASAPANSPAGGPAGVNPFAQFNQSPVTIEYRPPDNAGGIGAWNDFSATAAAARNALRKAAGVEVPGADFVVMCLAAYLVALVPLNWLVFHTIGRIEWAWIAAPIIAIAGTWLIVQRAQLDIGFVRAQTEIGVLELQPEHARAHLSRYTALYTSLSTTYDFISPNDTTLVTPFPTSSDFALLSGQSVTPVNFQRYDDVRMTGLPISSNSTGMIHSEQMQTLDGPIVIRRSTASDRDQIENHSKLELRSACVVRRLGLAQARRFGRQYEGIWIGDLLPGRSATLSMTAQAPGKPAFEKERLDEGRLARAERLDLEELFKIALDPKFLDEGELRLVARVDEVLPGETITPAASQVRSATLVVAHLDYALPPPPAKDKNTRRDIKAMANDPLEDEVE